MGTQPPLASLLQATLCGRLGEALKSDAYVDFRAGQPTRVNIVEVSGYCKTPLPSVWKKAQTIPIIF